MENLEVCPSCGALPCDWTQNPLEGLDRGFRCQTDRNGYCQAPSEWCDLNCPVRNGFKR